MDIFWAFILGTIQGLTEFLPVSSTGHLIIAEHLFPVPEILTSLSFNAAVHIGSLLALLIYFHKKLLSLIKLQDKNLLLYLLIGAIPAATIGFLTEDYIDAVLQKPLIVGVVLIVFSILFGIVEWWYKKHTEHTPMTGSRAVLIGIAQSIALIPGVSRSGMTITTGMMSGLSRVDASEFAFLLSIPIVLGAGGKEVVHVLTSPMTSYDMSLFAVGILGAFVSGYAAVAFLLKYFKTGTFMPFIIYRIILGIVVIGLFQ